MGGNVNKANVERAYARWAPIYDLVFGAMFEPGRHAAIVAAERIGGRILEVGVGTGIHCRIIRAPTSLSASTCPNRCCARRGRALPSAG